jgi:hypothetical protein
MNTPSPIFVCGTSRSGTSLLQAALDLNDDVAIAGETHYFDDLRIRLGEATARSPLATAQRRVVEDYFLALSHRPMGHRGDPERGWMRREELAQEAARLGGSADAYFESFCSLWARRHGKTRWGEKTPRHAFRIPEILSLYPEARAIYMLRDPRAVVASYRDWKPMGGFDFDRDPEHRQELARDVARANRSYHPVTLTLIWISALRAALQAQARFGTGRIRIQRYETLCQKPESELASINAWLSIGSANARTSVPVRNSSYDQFAEGAGFLTSGIDRWHSTLSRREIRVIERLAWPYLDSNGYEPTNSHRPNLLGCAPALLSACPAIARAVHANAHRSGNLPQYVLRRVGLLFSRV